MNTKLQNCVVVSNGKGGVGKTTTVVEVLGHMADLIKKQEKLLAIDLDPSGNLTKRLTGLKYLPEDQITITNYLLDPKNVRPDELMMEATKGWPNTYVIPSDKELTDICLRIATQSGWDRRLRKLVDELREFFAFIIIDTGPTLGMLHTMAFKAGDKVIIPADVGSDDALSGVHDVQTALELLEEEEPSSCHKNVFVFLAATHKDNSEPNKIAVARFKEQLGKVFLEDIRVPHRSSVGKAVWKHTPPIPAKLLEKTTDQLFVSYRKISSLLMN